MPSVPNPNLKPERARSEELAIEHKDAHGLIRLSLFNEIVKDALISQTGPLPVTPVQVGTFVQNVDRTRARGVELSVQRNDLLPRIDVSGSVTYADAITAKDIIFPAAVGKLIPSVSPLEGDAGHDMAANRSDFADRGGALCEPQLRRAR